MQLSFILPSLYTSSILKHCQIFLGEVSSIAAFLFLLDRYTLAWSLTSSHLDYSHYLQAGLASSFFHFSLSRMHLLVWFAENTVLLMTFFYSSTVKVSTLFIKESSHLFAGHSRPFMAWPHHSFANPFLQPHPGFLFSWFARLTMPLLYLCSCLFLHLRSFCLSYWAEAVLQEAFSDLTDDEALFLRSAVAHSAAFGFLRLPSTLSYFF